MTRSVPPIRRRWPLWLQLVLALFAALLLVNLLTVPLARHVVSDFEFKQVADQSRSSFALLAATALDAVITEDIPLLDTIAAQSLEQAPDMVGLSIVNEQNKLLVRRSRTNAATIEGVRSYRYPVEFEGERFGTIDIQWNIEPVQREIDRHVTEVQLFISAMLVLLTGLIVVLIQWLAVRPIRHIVYHLNSLSGNTQPPALQPPLSASRELELLAASANDLSRMMKQRDQRERELIRTRKELQVAHDEALSATRAKSGFLATMSHEIRAPMTAVLGVLGLLRDTPLNPELRQWVETGHEAGELLLGIINDILDFSKMEADKLQLEYTGFDLHKLFVHSVELFKLEADDKGLALEPILEPGLPRFARGDPDRLRQVLINLIKNAIKFTPSGGIRVRASATVIGEGAFTLHCEVQDSGIGIPKELQSSLFEKFTMADQGHARRHEGTGLGLAICERLVSLMHGSIGVISEPGNGSTFSFDVPLEPATEQECGSEPKADGPRLRPDAGTRLLLAEDNPANQMVIKRILECASLQVDCVADGREAVEAVSRLPYDMVLMDISMPEMDGMTATREIRKLSGPEGRIPIVALTAHALVGDKERFLDAGMDDYLTKPINRAATLNCIARWTGKSEPAPGPTIEPAEIPANSDNGYVDVQVLRQLAEDTAPELVPELLTLYIGDTRKRVEEIQHAMTEHDIETLEFEAHTLGSSAAAHGNPRLHALARKVERLCQDGSNEQALAEAASLPPVATESFRLLEKILAEGPI